METAGIEPALCSRRELLDRVADRVILTLELMSDVSAASLGQHVAQGKASDRILSLVGEPAHLRLRRRYQGCRTDEQRELVIRDGLTEIKAARYARRATVDCQTLEGRLMVGRDTRPAHIVAYNFGYTVRHIHRMRDEARRYDERVARRLRGIAA